MKRQSKQLKSKEVSQEKNNMNLLSFISISPRTLVGEYEFSFCCLSHGKTAGGTRGQGVVHPGLLFSPTELFPAIK